MTLPQHATARPASGAPLRARLERFRPTGDAYRMILFVLVVISISRFHQHFKFLRPLRPAFTLVMLAGIYAYLNPKYLKGDSAWTTWSGRMILLMGVMACLSVPFGISMGGSGAFILFEFSKTILLGVLVVLGVRHSRDLYRLVWAVPIAAGLLAYLSLFVFRMSTGWEGIARIAGGYTYDANDIALVANVGAAFTILAFQVSKGRGKLLCTVILVGLGATLAKTGSRGGFVGFVALGIGIIALLRDVPIGKRLGFAGAAFLGLLITAPAGYWRQMETILSPTEDYNWTSPNGRKEVFKRGVGYMMMNPVTGIGIDNFSRAEGTLSDRAIDRQQGNSIEGLKWSVAHNSYLQAAAEMGLLGLGVFCAMVFGGAIKAMLLRRKVPDGWARGTEEERFLYYTCVYLPVAFLAFAANAVFVSFAYMDLIYIMVGLVAGLETSIGVKLKEDAAGVVRGSSAPDAQAGLGQPAVGPEPRRYRGGLPPVPARTPAMLPRLP